MSTGLIVRQSLRVRERAGRTLDHRLALRFPRLAATSRRQMDRLPPSSRLRQVLLLRAVQLGVEAFNRRDMNAFLAGYHPGCTWYPPRELVDGGFAEQCYHGPAGFRTYALAWSEVVGPDLRLEPVELIDLWQRIVLLAELPVRAQGSGVPLTGEYAAVIALHEGTGIREHQYLDHSEALEAVGWGSRAGETSGVSDPQTMSPDTSTPAHRPDTPAPGETAHDPDTPAGDETPHRPDTPAAGDEPG